MDNYEFDELLKQVALESAKQMKREVIEDEHRAAEIAERDNEKIL